MNSKLFKILFIIIIISSPLLYYGCDEIKESDIISKKFTVNIDNVAIDFPEINTSVNNGIVNIVCQDLDNNVKTNLILTINAFEPGIYYQNYDPRTGVSISQCRLIVHQTNKNKESTYYSSYEGTVNISLLDTDNKKISGTFKFKLRNGINSNIEVKEGSFNGLNYSN